MFSLKNYTEREVFFLCLISILTVYILTKSFDSEKYSNLSSRIGSVEVSLDKVIDSINTQTIETAKRNDSAPHTTRIENKHQKFSGLYHTNKKINLSPRQFNCLAKNVYWESLREPLIGQIAVLQITHNRVKSKKWGSDYCSVVYQPKQFSWTNDKDILAATPKNQIQWKRAQHSVKLFANGTRVNNLNDSEFYYAHYIKPPNWSRNMIEKDHIGRHIFLSSLD